MSSQAYYPVAVLDSENNLQLVEYNRGIDLDKEEERSSEQSQVKFLVQNLKGPLDEIDLESSLNKSLSQPTFDSKVNVSVSSSEGANAPQLNKLITSEYRGTSIKVTLIFSGCSGEVFLNHLFQLWSLPTYSRNGVDDWIPLDTRTLVLTYPDYYQDRTTSKQQSSNSNNSTNNNGRSNFDWRLAHVEEAFSSFGSKDSTRLNVRKEGVIVFSVVRDWLITNKLRDFTLNLLLLSNLLTTQSFNGTKGTFFILAQFKQILDGFNSALQLYKNVSKYQIQFESIFEDHRSQMEAHLIALESHLSKMTSMIEENQWQDIPIYIAGLGDLLKLSNKTMMEFTVALKSRLSGLSNIRDSTHRKLMSSVVMATMGAGISYYTRANTKWLTKSAQLGTVAAGCSLIYYYHQLQMELDRLLVTQSNLIDCSTVLTDKLSQHQQNYYQNMELLLPTLQQIGFEPLLDDIKAIRSLFAENNDTEIEETPSPYSLQAISSWWYKKPIENSPSSSSQ